MTIGSRIKQRRKELGLTVDELAQRLGKNRATIYRYESDEIENLPTTVLEPLSEVLQTSPAFLMGWEDAAPLQLPNIFPIETKRIPLLGTIAAGKPIFADEHFESYVECGSSIHADFCLHVKGDSMINARIMDGDVVFIKQQPDVCDGEIAAVLIDGETTLKRVYKMPGMVQLQAENPKYKPMVFTRNNCSDFRILGKAVAFQGAIL